MRDFRRLQFFPNVELCTRLGLIVLTEICLKTKTKPKSITGQDKFRVLLSTKENRKKIVKSRQTQVVANFDDSYLRICNCDQLVSDS